MLLRTATRLAAGLLALHPPAAPAVRAQAPGPVAATEARTPEAERAGFRLPPGFAIELVASEPAIGKPMNLAFDARGRLWVTSTVEYPFPAPEGRTPRDRVLVLSDLGPDGRAGKVETFADGLNIPIGVLPLGRGDSALVHSIPSVRRYTDADGDGKADRSELAYEKIGSTDTHGMTNAFTLGLDGWVYACHGFSNSSRVAGSDGQAVVMQSGNLYRFRPDGSHAEIYSHGQVNPFGLALDPLGRLYSCDCHSKPIYQNIRGAFYPSFGRADDGLGFGPTMIDHDHGSTGIGGIAIAENSHFPAEYRGSIFLGNVVTGRVHRDTVRWQGSSPRAETQPDLITSDDPWFHPVDLEFGPDGALYIADFYNRIIGHYEVPLDHPGRDRERGRIWRVVYKGTDGTNPPPRDPRPDAVDAPTADLVADLGHPDQAIRDRATSLLVLRGGPEVVAAAQSAADAARGWGAAHALWVLQRLGALDDDRLFAASRAEDEAVRVHAMRIWGVRGSIAPAGKAAMALGLRPLPSGDELDSARAQLHLPRLGRPDALGLDDPAPAVRRAAVEALGDHPPEVAVVPLLRLLRDASADDDHLRHAARVALRDALAVDSAWVTLQADGREFVEPRATFGWGAKEIGLNPGLLCDVLLGLPTAQAATYLLDHLPQVARSPRRDAMVRHVARHAAGDPQARLVGFIRGGRFTPADRAGLIKAVAQGTQERSGARAPELDALAVEVVSGLLDASDPAEVKAGVDLAGSVPAGALVAPLAAVAGDRARGVPNRLAALGAWGQLDPAGSVAGLAARLVDAEEAPEVVDAAARALGAAGRDDARSALIEALARVPARAQSAVAAALAATKPGAEALLAAVQAGKASPRYLGEPAVALRLKASGLPDLQSRLDALLKDAPPADGRILATIDARRAEYHRSKGGDATLGAAVFAKNCAACHQMGGQGGRVGPQLDGVGVRGLDRLLEDVLDPNRNVDQAFRATTLALRDGRVAAGLVLRQDGAVLVLADAAGAEVRVPEADVEERKVAPISPMPANFADAVDPADFRHLMAYLLANRPAGTPGPAR